MFLINLMDNNLKHGTNDTPAVHRQPPKMYLLQYLYCTFSFGADARCKLVNLM